MTELDPPADGWWRASDGNWYPPESHADYATELPAAVHPAPPFEPPVLQDTLPHDALADGSALRPSDRAKADNSADISPWWKKKWWLILLVLAVPLLVTVARFTTASSGTAEQPSVTEFVIDVPVGEPTDPDLVDIQELGTESRSYDALVPVEFEADGLIWNVRVMPPQDITDAVMAANSFNDPPPDGVRFVGFDAVMILASAEQQMLAPGFGFSWELLGGGTSAVYDASTIVGFEGCGVTPNKFDQAQQVFVSGRIEGTVCIPVPVEDVDSPDTVVAMNIRGERIVFQPDGARPAPAQVGEPDLRPRDPVLATETSVPVTITTFDDADGSVWNLTVGPLGDVAQDMASVEFGADPPTPGTSYVGFDLDMTLASARDEPQWPDAGISWEIWGGQTLRVYTDLFGCGITPGDLNGLPEVFVGGTLSGLVCVAIPTEDLDHPDTQVALSLPQARVMFAADGSVLPPAEIEPGAGAAGVGEGMPLGETVDLDWSILGDADSSVWSTTITNWRDMTDDVLAENPLNEPPPDGTIFVGFDVEMTLIDAAQEPLGVEWNFTFEVLGDATNRVYDSFSVRMTGCGVTPNAFDLFDEVLVEGTLRGTICIPLPGEDFADPDTRIALNFSGDRVTFAVDG